MNWRLEVPYMGDGERIRNLIPSHAVWVYSPPGLLLGVGRIFYDRSQRERNSVPFFDQFLMKHSVRHFTHVASFYLHLKPLRWPQAGIRVSTERNPKMKNRRGLWQVIIWMVWEPRGNWECSLPFLGLWENQSRWVSAVCTPKLPSNDIIKR